MMEITHNTSGDTTDSGSPEDLAVEPAFMLLFAIHLPHLFTGFTMPFADIEPLPPAQLDSYVTRLTKFETQLLGIAFVDSRRITRWPLGRIVLNGLSTDAPTYADVYLLSHKSGAALWEVWLPAPGQSFDASRWIRWLDPEAEDGPIARLWRVLGPVNKEITGKPVWSGMYLPLTILRVPQHPLKTVVIRHRADLVRLLYLDYSPIALKPGLVDEELSRDYCAREGGLTLLARRSGLDVHGREDLDREPSEAGLPPRSALPFLITLELLLIERTVLTHLYGQLSRRMPGSVDELLALKQEVLDTLEEYYGTITKATRLSDAVTVDAERLFGLGDLYDAVIARLDTVSFAITTRYQKRMTLLQFWLTIVFGATEIGFIASGIATWYYRSDLLAVLSWTVTTSLVSGLVLILLLRGKIE